MKEVKEHFFGRIISKILYPEAIELLALILLQCKSSKDSIAELDWKQYPRNPFLLLSFTVSTYSQQIENKILPILSSTKERLMLSSLEVLFPFNLKLMC